MENASNSRQKERRLLRQVRSQLVKLTPLWLILLSPFFLFPSPTRALALLGLPFLWALNKSEKGYFVLRTPVDWPIFLLLLMTLVSLFVTFDLVFSLSKVAGLLFHIAAFYAIIEVVQTREGLLRSLGLYLLFGFVVIGLGLISTQWLFKVPLINNITARFPQLIQGLPGAESGIHPNQLAGTLLWFFPLQISLLWAFKNQPAPIRGPIKPFLWAALGATLGTFILTQSRGGWVGGIAALALLFAILNRTVRYGILVGGLLGLIGATIIGWSTVLDFALGDSSQAVVGDLGSLDFRQEIWRAAIWGVADFPFTGMGMGTFREVARLLYPLNVDPTYNISDAHNQFLQAALDLGIPGLVAFVAIWLGAAYAIFQLVRHTQDHLVRAISIGLAASLAGYFVFAFSNIVAFGAKPGIFFWWLLAFVFGLYRQLPPPPPQETQIGL